MKSENECKIVLGININLHTESLSENQAVILKSILQGLFLVSNSFELLLMETCLQGE